MPRRSRSGGLRRWSDGFGDILIGADGAGSSNQGEAYLVFGNATGGSFNLSALNGTNGLKFVGVDSNSGAGYAVDLAGDINGDGVNDFIIGARYSNSGNEGRTFVVFGGSANLNALDALDTPTGAVFLSSLNGTNGFTINGEAEQDRSGQSVARLGDVNGDGVDDLIVGAPRHNANGYSYAGAAYVVFGKPSGQSFAATLNPATLDGTNGFAIDGVSASDQAGYSVSSAGDVNGDGVADILTPRREGQLVPPATSTAMASPI